MKKTLTMLFGILLIFHLTFNTVYAATTYNETINSTLYWRHDYNGDTVAGSFSTYTSFVSNQEYCYPLCGDYIRTSGSITFTDDWVDGFIYINILDDGVASSEWSPSPSHTSVASSNIGTHSISYGSNYIQINYYNDGADSDGIIYFTVYFVPSSGTGDITGDYYQINHAVAARGNSVTTCWWVFCSTSYDAIDNPSQITGSYYVY